MKRTKNRLVSGGIVGISAVALSVSPALAASSHTASDKGETVAEISETGAPAALDAERVAELGLSNGVFKLVVEDDEKDTALTDKEIKVEEVLDDAGVKTGEKTTVTLENEGVWVFETDGEGKLVSVDFKPAEGFTGDPSVSYTLTTVAEKSEESSEAEEVEEETVVEGELVLDYPEVEGVEEAEETVDNNTESDEEKKVDDTVVEDLVKDEKVDDKTTTEEDTTKVEEQKEEIVEKEVVADSPEGEGHAVVARAFTTFAAPAAPVPAAPEDPERWDAPALTVNNASTTDKTLVKFGTNGESLPSGADTNTISFVSQNSTDVITNSGKKVEQQDVGTWTVENGNFVFTPASNLSENSATIQYSVRNAEGGGGRGTITVNFAADAGNNDNGGGGADRSPGVNPDSPSNSDDGEGNSEGPTVGPDGQPAPGDRSGNGPRSDNDEQAPGSEDSQRSPDSIETGAEMLSNNSAMYAVAAGIAGAIGLGFILLPRFAFRKK